MNPFTVLGVTPGASEEEIKKAWRSLCRKWHPDRKGGDSQKMAEVNVAYGILMDAEEHAWWVEHGEERRPDPLDQKARNVAMQMFMAVIQEEGLNDPYLATHQLLEQNIENFRRGAADCKRKIEALIKKRDKLKIKPGAGEMYIGGLFEQMLEGLAEKAVEFEGDDKTASRARELFDEWVENQKRVKADKGEPPEQQMRDAYGRKLDPKMEFLRGKTDFGPANLAGMSKK